MGKLYLLFFLIFISLANNVLEAQEWTNHLPKDKTHNKLTFYDIQKAFYKEYPADKITNGKQMVNGEMQKIPGWKQFKRWEWYWEPRVNPITGAFPDKAAIDKAFSSVDRAEISGGGHWTNMGPNSSPGGYAGLGRVNCIAFHPTNNDTYWIGSPSGGLWKTTDDGATWTVLTDNNDVLGVSTIIIHPDYVNNQTIFIGTGDRDGGSGWSLSGGQWHDNNSVGVLKSTDGGVTWEATGLSFNISEKKVVNKLLMNPDNNQILLAATSTAIYKTTDGGGKWNEVLSDWNNYIDMEFKPGDPNVVYASTNSWGGKIYRSVDAGGTWTEVYSDADANRIQLAVSANNPNWVYAIGAKSGGGLTAVYKSINTADSFSEVYTGGTDKALLGYRCDAGGDNRGQGWYDLCINADPNDANTVYIGGVNTWKSMDGGLTWSISTHWSGTCGGNATTVHADKHFLAFQRGTSVLFECNDGGVYKTTDGGDNWEFKGSGLSISQLYRIGVSQTVPSEVICGLQDNGTKIVSNNTWRDGPGGDGMECLIDYTDNNIQYATYTRGKLYRSLTAFSPWWSRTTISDNITGDNNGAWVTPYIIDPVDHETLYAGYADVWKTTDKGDSWTKISSMNTSYKLRSMAIAPSDNQTLYVANPNQIWKTTDGGTTWTGITTGLPVGSSNITYIAVKHDDPNTLWVTLGAYNDKGVYQSTDGGASWTNISAGLPQLPIMTIVQNKQNTSATELYVGTDVGVYKKEGNANWEPFCNQLPNVLVTELEFYYDDATPSNTKLRAATYGRGLWQTSLQPVTSCNLLRSNANVTRELIK